MDSRKTLWVSHSSITDFKSCLRLYYFKNIYRNPKTGNRIQLVNPYLSLGIAVHEAIDEVADLSPSKRLKISLLKEFEKKWKEYSGRKGGFVSYEQEKEFKERGIEMIKKFQKSDLLKSKSLSKKNILPKISLSENIELVGSLDWIELLPNNELHIIDFKTGRAEESKDSLQLQIYKILAEKNYGFKTKKLSYWYLDKDDYPKEKKINSQKESMKKIKEKAFQIENTIKKGDFSCSSGYFKCFQCREYEGILSGKAEYVGIDPKMNKELYFSVNNNGVFRRIEEGIFLNDIEKKIFKMRINKKNINYIQEDTQLTNKKIETLIFDIKKKIKDNLSKKELKLFVQELENNGNKLI